MKAKLLVQSTTIETYTNVMAALCDKYPINQVVFSFIDREPDEEFINNVQKKLIELYSNSNYFKASRVQIQTEIADKDHICLVKGYDIIDVSGVSKKIAINASAASISNRKVHICQLSWKRRFKEGEQWMLEEGNHDYTDLMSAGALSDLYQEYFKKKHIIFAFSFLFLIVFIVVVVKLICPTFIIPEDVVNLFSLLIGAAGLYLAIISFNNNND